MGDKHKRVLFALCAGFFLSAPVYVFANFGLDATAQASGLSGYSASIPVLLGNVVGALLSLIGIVFFVLVVYGGLMWMTAGGNQDTVKKSINTIVSAAIGLIVVLSAYAITNFVFDSVGGEGGSSSLPTVSGGSGGTTGGGGGGGTTGGSGGTTGGGGGGGTTGGSGGTGGGGGGGTTYPAGCECSDDSGAIVTCIDATVPDITTDCYSICINAGYTSGAYMGESCGGTIPEDSGEDTSDECTQNSDCGTLPNLEPCLLGSSEECERGASGTNTHERNHNIICQAGVCTSECAVEHTGQCLDLSGSNGRCEDGTPGINRMCPGGAGILCCPGS